MKSGVSREILWFLGVFVALLLAGVWYLRPGVWGMLTGQSGWILSDGGDLTASALHHWLILKAWRQDSTELLFGSLYTSGLNAPDGMGLWIPWIERLFVVIAGPWVRVEWLATGLVWALAVLNGMAAYAFGRIERWRPWIAATVAVCFAYNPYVRARGMAHPALVGVYLAPMILLALRLLHRSKGAGASLGAAGLLLGVVMGAHYLVLCAIALTPFWLWFYFREYASVPRRAQVRAGLRLLAVSLPAALLLVWTVLAPVHPKYRQGRSELPVQKSRSAGDWIVVYAARPIDYWSGDVALGADDWNPLRAAANRHVLSHLDRSNPMERTNGIRLLLLLPFLAMAGVFVRKHLRERVDPELRRRLVFALGLGLGAWLLSSSPRIVAPAGIGIGPSQLLHWIFPQFRALSRFGPVLGWATLMAWGYAMQAWLDRDCPLPRGRRLDPRFAWVIGLAVVLEYPGQLPLKTDSVTTSLSAMEAAAEKTSPCGMGMYLPFMGPDSGPAEERDFYRGMQRLRGTGCQMAHPALVGPMSEALEKTLSRRAWEAAQTPAARAEWGRRWLEYQRCARLDWVAVRPEFGREVFNLACEPLIRTQGWIEVPGEGCRAPRACEVVPGDRMDSCLAVLSR